MSKKVIWVINQTAGKLDSGWGERHHNFSKYWVQKGYSVKIISGSYNHLFLKQPKTSGRNFTMEEVEDGIVFWWVKIPQYDGGSVFKLWSMLVFAFRILFLKSNLLEKPEIIIVSSMPIFPILSAWYLKKKFRAKKLLFEIRDLWPLTPMELSGYSKFHPVVTVMRWIEKFGYKKSDAIVSLLPNAHTYVNKISGDPAKFNWISNGINENLLEQQLPAIIMDKIPADKFTVGYAGTMGMANALEYLIEASILMKEDTTVHFVLVGDGYLKEKLIEQTSSNTNITFIDKIEKREVQHLLQLFDVCFIGRSNTKLFDYGVASNKYFDYMLAKKPILESSNKIKSPAELSECGINVNPEDGEAIVQGIQKFQRMSTSQLKSIGMAGYDYVKKYHNFAYLSEKYLKLF